VWAGTYGAHGIEIVRLSAAPAGDRLVAVKLTGDLSVPAGETTFEILLHTSLPDGVGSEFKLPRDFSSDVEFAPESARLVPEEKLPGRARIAMLGFNSPSWTPAELLAFSEDCFGLVWTGIQQFSVFCRLALDGAPRPVGAPC